MPYQACLRSRTWTIIIRGTPQTVFALRGSHGVARVPGIPSSLSPGSGRELPRRARRLLKQRQLQYKVDIALVPCRRDNHFFISIDLLRYKSKFPSQITTWLPSGPDLQKCFPKDPFLSRVRLDLSAGKTCVVSAGKTSVVSATKASVVSAYKKSVDFQDIPIPLPTGPRCGRLGNDVVMSWETADVIVRWHHSRLGCRHNRCRACRRDISCLQTIQVSCGSPAAWGQIVILDNLQHLCDLEKLANARFEQLS